MSDVTIAAAAAAPDEATRWGPSPLARLGRELEFYVPLAFLVFVLVACFLLPAISSAIPDPAAGGAQPYLPAFSPHHLFGADPTGNDVASRLLYGGRVSLAVGFGATAIGMVVGGAFGVAAAYKGGVVDTVISRCLDMFLAFPALVLAMTVAAYLGPRLINVIWAISFFSTPAFARLARASTQRLMGQDFVTSSKLAGASDLWVMRRHIAVNVVPQLLTYSFLYVSQAIIIEASLSFLGLGVRPPTPTWGDMIHVGQEAIYNDPSLLLIPCAALFLTVLALNLFGDAVRARWAE